MKKIIFLILIYLCMGINVYAEGHDVSAKYNVSYDEDVIVVNLNNNKKTIDIDNYSIEFSSSEKIDVVIIKMENIENNYAKSFTNLNNNYFVMFYKNGAKVSKCNVNIDIKTNGKSISVYDNYGSILNISDNNINLNKNNYILTFVDTPDESDGYVVTDIDSLITDLENIGLNSNSSVLIYNNKNELIDSGKKLGTGYKVVIKNSNVVNEYIVVAKGDTTGDANINLNDITRLYHYYKKIEKMDEVFVLAGDVAKNDIINLNDITKIYHYYKKIISEL